MKRDKKHCIGCDQNYYNGIGAKECWNFPKAKTMVMYCIGWWTPQDRKENFMKVTTHTCHTEAGRFAYYNKLPEHLTGEIG